MGMNNSGQNKENESVRSFCVKRRRPLFLFLSSLGVARLAKTVFPNILCENLNS